MDGGSCGVVLSCSALKRKYREVLRPLKPKRQDIIVTFFITRGSTMIYYYPGRGPGKDTMRDNMVVSQLVALEKPSSSETDVTAVNANDSLSAVYVWIA